MLFRSHTDAAPPDDVCSLSAGTALALVPPCFNVETGQQASAYHPSTGRMIDHSERRHLGPSGVYASHIILDGVVDTPATRVMMPNKLDNFLSSQTISLIC